MRTLEEILEAIWELEANVAALQEAMDIYRARRDYVRFMRMKEAFDHEIGRLMELLEVRNRLA